MRFEPNEKKPEYDSGIDIHDQVFPGDSIAGMCNGKMQALTILKPLLRPFPCDFCSFSFMTEADRDNHKRSIHSGQLERRAVSVDRSALLHYANDEIAESSVLSVIPSM